MSADLWCVLWACFCTDVSPDPAVFDERCPCHDRERLGLEQITVGVSTSAGHICGAAA